MTQNKMTKIFNKKGGCTEDCFNCPFPDCYKPSQIMKTDESFFLSKAMGGGESQARMFTLELGGYGGARPNTSKKYLRSSLW